jgi:hypothetical protein
MTDRDRTTRPEDRSGERRDGLNTSTDARNRANQEAASRPGVDAQHGLDDRGHMVANPREGSAFEPLREGSDTDRDQRDPSDHVLDQGVPGETGRSGDQHMTSRQRGPGQHGDAIRESEAAPGGGSVFQPLEADPRHFEESEDSQQDNPAGQNQQGLNPRAPRDDSMPRRD